MSADITSFPNPNLSDIPVMLRKLALDIESGTHGEVDLCLVILPKPAAMPMIFGFGPEGDTSDAALIGHLDIAKHWFLMSYVQPDGN